MGKKLIRIFALLVILAVIVLPVVPAQAAGLTYPVLEEGRDYYQTTYPAGLQYSPGWYGTFVSAPPVADVILYDDDWSGDWGRVVFSMPEGVAPSGAQGGSTLQPITREYADAIVKSYSLDESVKPIDAEIRAVMPGTHYFTGVWAGEKLAQKWSVDYINYPSTLTQRQRDYVADTANMDIKTVDLTKYDPPRYWVGDGGDWTDNAAHWSAATGGAPGASTPTAADDAVFDGNSFTAGAQTVAVDAAAFCLDMNWTGATNTPTLEPSFNITISGSLTTIAAMTWTPVGTPLIVFAGAGAGSITTNGLTLGRVFINKNAGVAVTLQDTLTSTGDFNFTAGNLDTNNQALNAATMQLTGAAVRTLTMGTSVITMTSSWVYTGTNLTVAANTATLNVGGSFFSTAGIATYHDVNLTGATSTITGSNTFNSLSLPAGTTQTITFTDGTTQTATTFTLGGSAGHYHTLKGSGVGGWNISQAAGAVTGDFISVSRSTAGGGATFTATGSSINGGNNAGWTFPLTVSTQAATGITMDRDGITGGLLNGTITDMGGDNGTTYFEYGLTVAYGDTTAPVAYTAVGAFTGAMPTGLTPGETYHARAVMDNGITTANGADTDFVFTMPTTSTGVSSISGNNVVLNGTVDNAGVASNSYVFFQYGTSPALGSESARASQAGAGAFTGIVPSPSSDDTLYYRSAVANGATIAVGAVSSIHVPSAAGGVLLKSLLRVLLAAMLVVGVAVIGTRGNWIAMLLSTVVGIIAFIVVDTMIINLL